MNNSMIAVERTEAYKYFNHNIWKSWGSIRRDKPEYVQAIYNRDDHKCLVCNSDQETTVDHIHPQSKNKGAKWLNAECNLMILCHDCNRRKSNKTLDRWMAELLDKLPEKYSEIARKIYNIQMGYTKIIINK